MKAVPPSDAAEFNEPWTFDLAGRIFSRTGVLVGTTEKNTHAERIAKAVNFCEGMTNWDLDYFYKHIKDKPWEPRDDR